MSSEKPNIEETRPPTENPELIETKTSETRTESQVFSYTAPWLIYSLGFSCKPNQLYKIAVGSFLEEKENQVLILISFITLENRLFIYFVFLFELNKNILSFLSFLFRFIFFYNEGKSL